MWNCDYIAEMVGKDLVGYQGTLQNSTRTPVINGLVTSYNLHQLHYKYITFKDNIIQRLLFYPVHYLVVLVFFFFFPSNYSVFIINHYKQ